MNKKMKKGITTLVIVMVLSFSLVACGGIKNISLSQVLSDMKAKGVTTGDMKKGGEKELKRFYRLNSNDLEEFELYIPSTSMNVEEMLMVKVKNESQIDSVESAIENRINNQLESFNGYGVTQTALLNDYELKIIGDYIFFCVGKNAADMADNFKDIVK